jgi:predicted dehydrogenase
VINVGIVGLGKMGISHQAIINMHPGANLAAVCDASGYLLGVLKKYTGVATYSDLDRMLGEVELDALIVATPSRAHAQMVKQALQRDLHVFCEKPLTLDVPESVELTELAADRGLATQVGYHNRFIGAFREVKALLDAGAIGTVSHALGEAYGPVVLKPKGKTWRSQRQEGGGCLYDYAAHPINLINWYLGEPVGVGGTVLKQIFSEETDDEVFGTLFFSDGKTAQISANWSDDSQRKMTTQITIWGSAGRIEADRQECRAYLRGTAPVPVGYTAGWNVRYTTDLTEPVWFYLRGEEYSAQIDHFVRRVQDKRIDGENAFESALVTDRVIAMMISDAERGAPTAADGPAEASPSKPRRTLGFTRR